MSSIRFVRVASVFAAAIHSRMTRLDEGGKPSKVFALPSRHEGHRLFAAYHPPEGMRRLLAGRFEVVEHVPGGVHDWGIQQDVWVLERI